MTTHKFDTHKPVDLYVENGSGTSKVQADETDRDGRRDQGRHADEARSVRTATRSA